MKMTKSHSKRILVAAILMGVLAIAAFMIVFTTSILNTRTDQKALSKAEAAALSVNKYDTDEKIAYLQNYGLDGNEVYRATVSSCFIDHDDSGFFATNYNQKCYLQTTVGVSVQSRPAITENTKLDYPWGAGYEECDVAHKWGDGYTDVVITGPKLPDCERPNPAAPNQSVVAYAVDNVESSFVSETSDEIPDGSMVVWITHSTEYWNQNLGCQKPTVLFCESPRSSPVMPKR